MNEKYNKLLVSFEKIIKNTKDNELYDSAKSSYIYFIKELAIIEKKDINIYIEKLQSLDFSVEQINEFVGKINSTFSKSNEQEIAESIEENFDNVEVTDKKNEVSNNYIEENDEDKEEINVKLEENNEVIEENKDKVEENNEVIEENKDKVEENLEEYVFMNVYRNKNQQIGDELQNMVYKLQTDLKNPNDMLIETWINNYFAFINKFENELNKDKMTKYMFELFEKNDKERKYIDRLPNIIENIKSSNNVQKGNENIEESKASNEVVEEVADYTSVEIIKDEEGKEGKVTLEEKPLKILNIKKSFKSPKVMEGLKASALFGIGGVTFGIPGIIGAGIIWSLYKKGITSAKFKKFLKEHNFTIDEKTKELRDSNGEIITEEKIGKSKYEMLKQYLLKMNTKMQEGKIKFDYKKNKIASNLLNSKFVSKLNWGKKNKNIDTEYESIEKNEEMYKGMGNVK